MNADGKKEKDSGYLSVKEQAYAGLVASGVEEKLAWAQLSGRSVPTDADRKGVSRMSHNVRVQEEILRIRREAEKLAGGTVMSVAEKRQFLALVKRTPLGEIDETNPICIEMKRTKPHKAADPDALEQAELWETETVKKPCPLRAIDLDNKMAGVYAEDQRADAEKDLALELMARIRAGKPSVPPVVVPEVQPQPQPTQ